MKNITPEEFVNFLNKAVYDKELPKELADKFTSVSKRQTILSTVFLYNEYLKYIGYGMQIKAEMLDFNNGTEPQIRAFILIPN